MERRERPQQNLIDVTEDFLKMSPNQFREKLHNSKDRLSLKVNFSDLDEVKQNLLLSTMKIRLFNEVTVRATQQEHDSHPEFFKESSWEKID
jgi:hypothetical protein